MKIKLMAAAAMLLIGPACETAVGAFFEVNAGDVYEGTADARYIYAVHDYTTEYDRTALIHPYNYRTSWAPVDMETQELIFVGMNAAYELSGRLVLDGSGVAMHPSTRPDVNRGTGSEFSFGATNRFPTLAIDTLLEPDTRHKRCLKDGSLVFQLEEGVINLIPDVFDFSDMETSYMLERIKQEDYAETAIAKLRQLLPAHLVDREIRIAMPIAEIDRDDQGWQKSRMKNVLGRCDTRRSFQIVQSYEW